MKSSSSALLAGLCAALVGACSAEAPRPIESSDGGAAQVAPRSSAIVWSEVAGPSARGRVELVRERDAGVSRGTLAATFSRAAIELQAAPPAGECQSVTLPPLRDAVDAGDLEIDGGSRGQGILVRPSVRGYAAVLDAVHLDGPFAVHAAGGAIGAFTANVTWPAEGTALPTASRDASGDLALGWPAEWPAPRVALLGADGVVVSVCAVRTNGARGTVSGRDVRSVARVRLDFVRLDLVAVSADTNVRIEAHDVRDIDVR